MHTPISFEPPHACNQHARAAPSVDREEGGRDGKQEKEEGKDGKRLYDISPRSM
jgi:hypothetical protein